MAGSPRTIREEGRVASAWAISIVGHLVAFGLGGLLVASTLGRRVPPLAPLPAPPPAADDDLVDIQLPTMIDGTRVGSALPPPAPSPEALARGGGEGMPRLDTGHPGRGGDDASTDPALNLADRDDRMLLSPEVQSRLDRSQIQRLRASARRASREDWRASREPMELTFLAQGTTGHRPEHRAPADRDPSSGARDRGAPQRRGGALGAAELPPGIGESPREPGGPIEGAARSSVGLGVRDGVPGGDHRDSARVALARPMVNQGTPSVPSNARDRPTDNVDAEQEVATAMQSILHASNAGGAPGPGGGGQSGPGPAGAGGVSGPGSVSRAMGTGVGPGLDVDPRDKRRMEYQRQVIARVYPHTANALPKWAAYDGAQGVVIVTFTILADGSVVGAAVTRQSGIPELDENCRRALLQAAPFPPLPPELGKTFRWAMPFDFRNPAVKPRTAKVDPAVVAP